MSPSQTVRAAVPEYARDTIATRAPDAEVVAIDDLDDLVGVRFAVPIPYRQPEFAERLPGARDLRVVQTLSAGVDALAEVIPEYVILCSARGARDSAVAEWVLGALLGANTHVAEYARARTWERSDPLIDIADSTVLIVGMGSIGRAVAARLEPFEAHVIGVASHARDDLHGVDELPGLLPRADAVVILTPLSDATEGLFDAAALARMHDGALIVNAGRGPVLDSDALVAETESGRLRAVLDVTDPEPLPDGHPLWRAAGVLSITPHIAGNSARANQLAAELAGDQLARYAAGEPLQNIVHAAEGNPPS